MAKSNAVGTQLIVNSKKVGALNSIDGIEITAETIDVTDFDNATGYREKIAGFKEVGDLACEGFLDGADAGQDECYALLNSGDEVDCSIVFPSKIGKTWSFKASVIGFTTSVEVDDAITFEVTFAVTGQPVLAATQSDGGEG